jgi:hypothetical protein
MKKLLQILSILLLTSCSAMGEKFEKLIPPKNNKAVVYLYRAQIADRSLTLSPGIALNHELVGSLPLDGFLRLEVEPGFNDLSLRSRTHHWPIGGPTLDLRVDAKSGEIYFVEFAIKRIHEQTGYLKSTHNIYVSLRQVSRERGLEVLSTLKSAL